MMPSREERENRVIELHEQHKSTRDIAKDVHMNFSEIGSIIRRYHGEAKVETKKQEGSGVALSKDTQVFKLFELGKAPIDVTIELDLKPDEVVTLYKQWLELKGLHEVNQLYEERKQDDDLSELLELHNLIQTEGLKPRQLVDAAHYGADMSALESRVMVLKNECQSFEEQSQRLPAELNRYGSEKATLEQDLNSLASLITSHKQEISVLINRIQQLEGNIARLKDTREYHTVQAVAEQVVLDVLADKQYILVSAFLGVIEALAKEPDLKFLISGSQLYPMYDPRTRVPPQNLLQSLQADVLKLAYQLQNHLLAKCVNLTISTTLDRGIDPHLLHTDPFDEQTKMYNRRQVQSS
jgi:CII-binding regulator of phage lambda lysogenization HflD